MPQIQQAWRIVCGCFLILFVAFLPTRSQSANESGASSPEAMLKDLATAEAKRGVVVFYTQSFIDKENQRASYQGSVYGGIQELKLNGDEVTIETLMVDKFSGTVGKAPTGEQQDSYLYSITFVLTGEIARSLTLIQARPAPLGQHTNTICSDNPSCAFTWLRIEARRPVMKETTLLNGSLTYSGRVDHFLVPLSSPAAGNGLIEQLSVVADRSSVHSVH